MHRGGAGIISITIIKKHTLKIKQNTNHVLRKPVTLLLNTYLRALKSHPLYKPYQTISNTVVQLAPHLI